MKSTKSKVKNKQSTASGEQVFPSSFIKNVLKGFVFEVLVGILLILAFGAVLLKAEDPDRLILPISVLSVFITAFTGGAIISRINRNAPMICGFLNGALFVALLFILSLFVTPYPYKAYSQSAGVILRFLLIPVSLLGALAVSRRTKRRDGKRRRRKGYTK